MKKLILTVGLPRSGKSTWAREQGFPIVNPDSVRLAIHGEAFIAKAEPIVWQHVFIMAEALFNAGHETIIIDATNTMKRRRDEWKNKFPDAEIQFQVFETPAEECIRRAVRTGQLYLIPVIERMEKQWDLTGVENEV